MVVYVSFVKAGKQVSGFWFTKEKLICYSPFPDICYSREKLVFHTFAPHLKI